MIRFGLLEDCCGQRGRWLGGKIDWSQEYASNKSRRTDQRALSQEPRGTYILVQLFHSQPGGLVAVTLPSRAPVSTPIKWGELTQGWLLRHSDLLVDSSLWKLFSAHCVWTSWPGLRLELTGSQWSLGSDRISLALFFKTLGWDSVWVLGTKSH